MSNSRSSRGEANAPSVLHVVSYYPPDRIGGVGEHVRVIHEGHVDLGIESEILTSGTTKSDPRIHRIGRTPTSFFLQVWRKAHFASQFDVVQVHHGEGLLLLLSLRLRPRRPRILTMFHVDVRRRERASRAHLFEGRRFGPSRTTEVFRRFTGLLKATVDRIAWMAADAVVAETESVKSELSDMWPAKAVTVIPHGLGNPEILPDPAEPVELLYVGTPGTRKRTHLLPRILKSVRDAIPNARLRIVGFDEGADLDLYQEAKSLDVLDAIEFMGSVRSEDVISHYRSAQVLVVPSAYEGLPMVLLEAMREGLPAVATRVSGHPDAIEDGVNGYLIDLDNLATFGERCTRILRDFDLRNRLTERARETVKLTFSLESELDHYLLLYRDLVQFDSG